MQKQLLLGVEDIAQGAIDGGISGVFAYPGTPSTEITEYIQESKQAIARHSHGNRIRNVLCRKKSLGVYETRGNERGRRLFHERCHNRG